MIVAKTLFVCNIFLYLLASLVPGIVVPAVDTYSLNSDWSIEPVHLLLINNMQIARSFIFGYSNSD